MLNASSKTLIRCGTAEHSHVEGFRKEDEMLERFDVDAQFFLTGIKRVYITVKENVSKVLKTQTHQFSL